MTTSELEQAINSSEVIVSRSGYTTIMDLAVLGKKAFFIPTPGQNEQLYLAKRLDKMKCTPFSFQHEFKIEDLDFIKDYSGFSKTNKTVDFETLFEVFKS